MIEHGLHHVVSWSPTPTAVGTSVLQRSETHLTVDSGAVPVWFRSLNNVFDPSWVFALCPFYCWSCHLLSCLLIRSSVHFQTNEPIQNLMCLKMYVWLKIRGKLQLWRTALKYTFFFTLQTQERMKKAGTKLRVITFLEELAPHRWILHTSFCQISNVCYQSV